MSRLQTLAKQLGSHVIDHDALALLVAEFDDLHRILDGVAIVALGIGLRAVRPGAPLAPAIILCVRDAAASAGRPSHTPSGSPIHVEVIGSVESKPVLGLGDSAAFRTTYPNPPGGVSIAPVGTSYSGTLGCYLTSQGATYLLTARHVLDPTLSGAVSPQIQQPSAQDGNTVQRTLATTVWLAALDPSANNNVNAGVARLVMSGARDPRMLTGPNTFATLITPTAVAIAASSVRKSGRTTGLTQGVVQAVNVTIPVMMPDGRTYKFQDSIMVRNSGGQFASGGDSGALLVNESDQPVGLLFATSRDAAFATPIAAVLTALRAASGQDFEILCA